MLLQAYHSEKRQALLDLLSVYAAGGKAIVFTRTKVAADEVAAAISQQQACEALHGDIAQNQREKTLGRFRTGDVTVLIATDVAARGLDIPNVDLVVHYDPPSDSESFLHRSGRTARAGNKGRAIVMHTPSEARQLGQILQQVGRAVRLAASCKQGEPGGVSGTAFMWFHMSCRLSRLQLLTNLHPMHAIQQASLQLTGDLLDMCRQAGSVVMNHPAAYRRWCHAPSCDQTNSMHSRHCPGLECQ